LEEAQAGMKTAGRNINNLRYADDTTLMAESEDGRREGMEKKSELANSSLLSAFSCCQHFPSGFAESFLFPLGMNRTDLALLLPC